MKVDLAGMIRATGATRRPYVLGKPIVPTRSQERDLLAIYMRVVNGWIEQWGERILAEYRRTVEQSGGMRDSVETTQGAVDDAAAAMTRLRLTLDANFEDWEVRVERWHRAQFAQSFTPAGVRLDTLLGAGEVRTTMQAVLAENTALIRSLDDQMRNGISGAVFRGLNARTPARDVAREIRKLTGIGKRRAELIAADQLQKLSARLDQERQQQVGAASFRWLHSGKKFPRQEHVARNGKVYKWDSPVGRDDPPGRAIRCGCRSQPIIELEADAVAEVEALPEPPIAAPVAPPPPPKGYRPVRRADVNAGTIKVASRLALQKMLRPQMAANAADARYDPRREFGDRTEKDFGNVTFAAALDDEAASMVAAIIPELDDLADQIGVMRLRGFKSISGSKHIANQGDGVMALNPTFFNAYAAEVGGRTPTGALDAIGAQRAALQAEIKPLVDRIGALRDEMKAIGTNDPRWLALYDEQTALFVPYKKLRAADEKLWKRENVLRRAAKGGGVKGQTTWKPGDDVKGRPHSAGAYFSDGVDQARATLYHEFGHHVHQYLKKQGPRRQYGKPPLERDLATYFRQAQSARGARQASSYSLANEHEWFAENFALYTLGRLDLVDEAAKGLIDRIFRNEY